MSAAGIPQIAVEKGTSTAGGAQEPARAEQAISDRRQGTNPHGGPPPVKAATGEEGSAEAPGGADEHTRIAGETDKHAQEEEEAGAQTRDNVTHRNQPPAARKPPASPAAPQQGGEEQDGITASDPRHPREGRAVAGRSVDGGGVREIGGGGGKGLGGALGQIAP
jgi:Acetyl-CoA carboxylase, carboxyltransferase component (subunits alpha and beta)